MVPNLLMNLCKLELMNSIQRLRARHPLHTCSAKHSDANAGANDLAAAVDQQSKEGALIWILRCDGLDLFERGRAVNAIASHPYSRDIE